MTGKKANYTFKVVVEVMAGKPITEAQAVAAVRQRVTQGVVTVGGLTLHAPWGGVKAFDRVMQGKRAALTAKGARLGSECNVCGKLI